jgi:hypothetical protein
MIFILRNLILSSLLFVLFCSQNVENDNKKKSAALLLLPTNSNTEIDVDQARIDALDADIINPGALNMNVKSITASNTVYIAKNYSFSASIQSDYDAKNVLIRFVFINKSQIDSGQTTSLKQFEILDKIDYIKKGTHTYSFTVSIPDAGNTHSGLYTIIPFLDPENKRENYTSKAGMLSGVKKDSNTNVLVNSSTSGTRDIYLKQINFKSNVLVLKTAQNYLNTEIGVSGDAYSDNLDSNSVDIEFFLADTNGNKLPALGKLLVFSNGSTLTKLTISKLTANRKTNFDTVLVPESSSSLTSIANYVTTNGANSLRIFAEINPSGVITESNPANTTSNIATTSITTAISTAIKSVEVKNSNLNTSPLKEYSVGFNSGVLGDKAIFGAEFNFQAYAKMLKNTTLIAHADANSRIYLFTIIDRTLLTAYAHAELIPIRMKDSFVDAEVKAITLSGDLATVFKLYETGARSYYWYTTKYKEKEIKKRIFPYGIPVLLTAKLAGILLSKNKKQLSECNIYNCKPEEYKEGFSTVNYKDYSVAQIHIRNNFEFNANPRILLRGFGQAKPDTGITIGIEGQLTIVDLFPEAKATATVRMINNAYQVEIEFKETLDIYLEYLYGKIEVFLEIPYPSVSFWDVSIEYYRKYWTVFSWDSAGDYKKRLMDESQFLRIHLYTGQVDFTY